MKVKHICIRNCYYNERYWSAGEVIEETSGFEDMPPNKHFVEVGAPRPKETRPVIVSGDDPRSTKQIRADLKKKYPSAYKKVDDPEKASRKILFAAWREAEAEAGNEPSPAPDKTSPVVDDPEDGIIPSNLAKGAPINVKRIAEMTPDELDGITKKDIADRLGVSFTTYNKEGLIERAIEAGV